ncbi:MAG: hypothetical protein MUC79_03995 [Thiobacillaceae bacterium]|jgi:hypothetical protein|nr:hypothetical protein [Thiobacillaceae bacterium]
MTDAARLLDAWETALPLSATDRAVALLGAWLADTDAAALPVGVRESELLQMRVRLLGDALPCETCCPACGEAVEFTLSAARFLTEPEPGPCTLEMDGWRVICRPPDSRDVAWAMTRPDGERALLEACVLEAWQGDAAGRVADLPTDVVAAIEAALEETGPLACPRLDLTCPACGHAWQADWDIAAHVYREMQDWAEDLLDESARVALAYAMPLDQALALTPWRRRFLLERAT